MALIGKEEGAGTVRDLLERASGKENEIHVSTVTAIEVFYISLRKQGRAVAEERIELLETLPLIQEPLTPDLCRTIGELKATKPMSFADCCIAGLSKTKSAILVHKDPEFESVEDEIRQLKLPYKRPYKRTT